MKIVASMVLLLSHWHLLAPVFAHQPTSLVVVMGGYQSCGETDAVDPLPVPTVQEIASRAHWTFGVGEQVTYLYACYSGLHLDFKTIELQFAPDVNFSFRNRVFLSFDNFNDHSVFDQQAEHKTLEQ